MRIIGHKKILGLLDRAIAKNKVAQSYLFSGPEAVGKFTIAKIFAENLIGGGGEPLSGAGQGEAVVYDLTILAPEIEEKKGVIKEKKIDVDKIRQAQKNLALYPHGGKYKILLINNAHKLTEQGQNALLKTLEEPNPTSVMILVTHEEARLLPTIKSRCQNIKFNLVATEEISRAVVAQAAPEKLAEVARLAMGRPGLATRMVQEEKFFQTQREAMEKLKIISKAGINQRFKMAEELSKNSMLAAKTLELWIWLLHERAIQDNRLFSLIEKMENCLGEIQNTNVNARLALENLMLSL